MIARTLTRCALAALLIAFAMQTASATPFSLVSSPYSQNFDGMANSGTASLPGGWVFNSGTSYTTGATTATTQFGGTTGTGVFGGSSSGGAYEMVDGVRASGTDKAIGYLSSGSFTDNRNVLFAFTNATSTIITKLTITWDYEKYRSGTADRAWTFFASGDDTTWGSAIAAGGQSYAADANNTTVSNPPASVSKSVTLLLNLALTPSSTYYFRWNYDGTGTGVNGQALAIDNFALSATPEPGSLTLLGMGLLGLNRVIRRRRS